MVRGKLFSLVVNGDVLWLGLRDCIECGLLSAD